MRSIDDDDPMRRSAFQVIAFTGLLTLVVAALVGMGLRDSFGREDADGAFVDDRTESMVQVAPGGVLRAGEVPEALVVWYQGAERHPDVFAEVPCFCGCAAMLDHRHLLDCFVRADGDGWEAHALGCGVCLGEAEQVLGLVAEGVETPQIVEAIVERWSDPYLDLEE